MSYEKKRNTVYLYEFDFQIRVQELNKQTQYYI